SGRFSAPGGAATGSVCTIWPVSEIHSTVSVRPLPVVRATRRETPLPAALCHGPATRTRTTSGPTGVCAPADIGANARAKASTATQRNMEGSSDIEFARERSMFLDETEAGIGLGAHQ